MRLSAAFVVVNDRRSVSGRLRPSTVTVSSSPSRTLGAVPGCSVSRRRAKLEEQTPGGGHVGTAIGALPDRLGPRPLPIRQMIEDVLGLVDLAALHQGAVAEEIPHGLP